MNAEGAREEPEREAACRREDAIRALIGQQSSALCVNQVEESTVIRGRRDDQSARRRKSCILTFAANSRLKSVLISPCRAAKAQNRPSLTISYNVTSGVHRIAGRLGDRSAHQPSEPAHGGLAPAAHRRVNDMIAAALDDISVPSPTLPQLADAVNLSVNHFIRAFRQQTGVTPHRHVVLRRLERGIGLLKKPGTSVAEVADEVGFATPAHFVATFRRMMGVTPGAFRTALLS
jgi:AraC-like DNA-binding protein